jgi:hypothetical protein
MNRFKKYVQSKGIKLEQDYIYLPMQIGSVTVEAVFCNAQEAKVVTCYDVGTGITKFDRYGNIEQDFL